MMEIKCKFLINFLNLLIILLCFIDGGVLGYTAPPPPSTSYAYNNLVPSQTTVATSANINNNDVSYNNNNGCNPDRLAVYKVVLHTYWTRDLFPKHYPDWRPPAQWTKTFGRSHDPSYNLFRIGAQASPGMRAFVETGKSDSLEIEQLENRREKIYDEFTIPAINSGGGRSETNFFVDGNHSMVSLMTRIVPSPDWFIGVDSFQLCVGGSWIDSVTVEMDPLDAGTDNGFTFTAPNWPTDPQGIIYRITSRYPAHPAGSFYYPNSKRLPPIATFQFIKLKEYELSEVFNHIEDDRKYETVKAMKNHLEIEHNHIDMNNELSADIEKERQYERPPQPTQMTARDRKRAKLLAKMKSDLNTTITSTISSNRIDDRSNYLPKNDKNAILNNIASNYAIQQQNRQKRPRRKKVRPPKDCRVGHWSDWSPCSQSCGIGEMHRYRKVLKYAKRGGRPCPPLQESKWCGSARDCQTPASYFKW